MKELIGKLLEYRKRNTTILIILLVIVLITLLFLNGTISMPFGNKKTDTNDKLTQDLLEQAEIALKNDLIAQQNAPDNKIAIKIATLSSDDYDGIITGTKVGCDIVRMVYRYIEPTPAILNATMKELFAYNQQFDYMPGNFVASQKKLQFEKAVLENGTAKIYLKGEVVYGGVCDDPRLTAQITETAKQFDTVQNVEIYLNGSLYEIPSQK